MLDWYYNSKKTVETINLKVKMHKKSSRIKRSRISGSYYVVSMCIIQSLIQFKLCCWNFKSFLPLHKDNTPINGCKRTLTVSTHSFISKSNFPIKVVGIHLVFFCQVWEQRDAGYVLDFHASPAGVVEAVHSG